MSDRTVQQLLMDLVEPTNGGDPQVLNQEFRRWEEAVRKKVSPETRYNFKDYTDDDDTLLVAAEEHAAVHSRPLDAPEMIILTHPFYLTTTHMHLLDTKNMLEDARNYMMAVERLLRANLPRDRVNVVLFETLHHYAAASSRLLEQGLVDGVFFTEYDRGVLLNTYATKLKPRRAFYCGGGYNGRCLRSSVKDIAGKIHDDETLSMVSDLVIDSPEDNPTGLRPDVIEWPYAALDKRRYTVRLEEVLGRFNGSSSR